MPIQELLESKAKRYGAYVVSALVSAFVGYYGQALAEGMAARPWGPPLFVTALLTGTIGLISVVLIAESAQRKSIERKLKEGQALHDQLRQEIDSATTALKERLPLEVQALRTEVELRIASPSGDRAIAKKTVLFKVMSESPLTLIRDSAKFDGPVEAPDVSIEHCLVTPEDAKRIDFTNPLWDTPFKWERVTCPGRMTPCPEPFPTDWVVNFELDRCLQPGHIYRKTVTFRPADSYKGRSEWHSHEFEREVATSISILFHSDYAGGIKAQWMAGLSLPLARLRRRYRNNEDLPVVPAEDKGGAVCFNFPFPSPQLGDKFLLTWTNPTVTPRPPTP